MLPALRFCRVGQAVLGRNEIETAAFRQTVSIHGEWGTWDARERADSAFARRVITARAGVEAADVALENTRIRAPFDGTVLTKNADVGEVVTGAGLATKVARLRPLVVVKG